MKLDHFRAPALAATAVLLLSGVASAFAASPAPVTPVAPVAPVTQAEPAGPDTDTLQVGDQTTPDVAGAAESAAEPAGPDADTLQEGDQTTPDVADAPEPADASSEAAAEAPAGTEVAGAESDGPGGHQDPAGQNVDHQFDGEE